MREHNFWLNQKAITTKEFCFGFLLQIMQHALAQGNSRAYDSLIAEA